jgi:hypothetical protein
MKMVYSNENSFLVNNMKNLIEAQSIDVFIKNEYAQGGVGEISAFDCWPELWVVDDADYERVMAVVTSYQQPIQGPDWVCNQCTEANDVSFEVCWNCSSAENN